MCNTNDNGPSPNTVCEFPFEHGGSIMHQCDFGKTPSADDPDCRDFRRSNPDALVGQREEAHLFRKASDAEPYRKCYYESGGAYGWCATCNLATEDKEINKCGGGAMVNYRVGQKSRATSDSLYRVGQKSRHV